VSESTNKGLRAYLTQVDPDLVDPGAFPNKRLRAYLPLTPKAPPPPPSPRQDDEFDALITDAVGVNEEPVTAPPSPEPANPPTPESPAPDLHALFDQIERMMDGTEKESLRERLTRLLLRVAGDSQEVREYAAAEFPTVTKSPYSVKRVVMDWAGWLEDANIASSEWVGEGVVISRSQHTPKNASVFVAGGDLGKSYIVTNRITDTHGRREDRSVMLMIKQT